MGAHTTGWKVGFSIRFRLSTCLFMGFIHVLFRRLSIDYPCAFPSALRRLSIGLSIDLLLNPNPNPDPNPNPNPNPCYLTQLDSAQSECSPARLMARALNQTWPVWLRSSGSESAMEVLVTPSRVRVSLAQAIS